jgi:hypothetical protein
VHPGIPAELRDLNAADFDRRHVVSPRTPKPPPFMICPASQPAARPIKMNHTNSI